MAAACEGFISYDAADNVHNCHKPDSEHLFTPKKSWHVDAGVGVGLDGGYGVVDLDSVGWRDLYWGDPVEESRGKAGCRGKLVEFLSQRQFCLYFDFSRITHLTSWHWYEDWGENSNTQARYNTHMKLPELDDDIVLKKNWKGVR